MIFDIVCAKLADSEDGIVNFIAETYAYLTVYEHAGGLTAVRAAAAQAVRQCTESGLVAQEGQRLYPTQLAQVFGSAGLSLAALHGWRPFWSGRSRSSHAGRI